MRVAHVIYHLGIGGGEVFLADLAVALAQRGVGQHVYCIGRAGPLEPALRAAGIDVDALGKSTTLGLSTMARLARAVGRGGFDVVQLHGEAGLFWGMPAARLAGRRPIAALIYQNCPETRLKMAASRTLLSRADVVIAGSAAVERFAVAELGAPPARTRVIHCGIDVARFSRDAERAPGPGARTVMVTTGRLVPRKGQEVAIQAAAIVARTRPDVELCIVGDGPDRSRLERLALESGLGARVRFLGTVWPTVDVLREADLFLFPSLEEPQGLALLEACAAGVPVIASRTGGIPEMVTDGESARLVPPGDARALAAAILELAGDPARARALARRAAERARVFDIGRIADAWLSLYREMTGDVQGPTKRASESERVARTARGAGVAASDAAGGPAGAKPPGGS